MDEIDRGSHGADERPESTGTGSPTDETPRRVQCQGEPFVLYLEPGRIRNRIRKLGAVLSDVYEDRRPIFVGVLNGAFVFLSDLLRAVRVDCEVDFIKLSSYGAEKVSRGEVTELKEIDADLSGRHVVLVEDIVDTGLSMQYVVDRLEEGGPRSIRTVTFLHKPVAREHAARLDYVAFEIPDRFVIGYGMDFGQTGRNWPGVYVRDRADEPRPPRLPDWPEDSLR